MDGGQHAGERAEDSARAPAHGASKEPRLSTAATQSPGVATQSRRGSALDGSGEKAKTGRTEGGF